ncbi:MAG: exodeoxyribonuclease V subunit beta [Burkholderiales bacterium]|nr:exodeoxyribonuclease V subunit beta [Burkholderiales bacterium]
MTPVQSLEIFECPLHGVRLIEASAGTGKTYNICGLYLRLLLERGLDVQQVLVVTFTNAATAELRDRIRTRIAEVLAVLEGRPAESPDPFVADLLAAMRGQSRTDDEMRARLTKALRTFDEAAIFTIHGFCKRALDDAPFAAGLPLAQELTEDDSDLRNEVAADFWRKHVAGGDLHPALADWLVRKKDSPEQWAKNLRRHSAKPLAHVEWPQGTDGPVTVALPDEFVAAFDRAQALWMADRGEIIDCVKRSLVRLNGNRYSEESIDASAQQWDEIFIAGEPAILPGSDANKLHLLATVSLKPKKNHVDCDHHDFFALAQVLVDGWDSHKDLLELGRLRLIRRLVEEGPEELRARKRARRVVAFDDMLFNLYERLDLGVAATLRARFPAALVDEFQDTDPLQLSIFERIYAGHTDSLLFLVGDPKQAIYSFRNADLHTYLEARKKAEAEYTLQHNQRSTPELLRALNALFGANTNAFQLEGLNYRQVEAGQKPRKPFVDKTEPRAPLHLWSLPQGTEKFDARQSAVRACAAEIARLLAGALRHEVLHDGRPLQAGEIAVLVRSHQEGSDVREALLALGVGSVELRQTSVFRTPDAAELESLLLAVAEPSREHLLRTALATELLGLDANAIDLLSDDESAVLQRIERFDKYRRTWRERGIAPMLRELFTAEGVHARMLRRPDGERRLTNLRHLSELLNEAAQDHPGTDALLRWLQRQRRDAQAAEATQVRLESDRNLVQIVTIHKAKGLEYPVVFCPFLWNGHPGGRNMLPGYEYHDDAGRTVIDYRPADEEMKARTYAERNAERLRLAYVALTRAIHRCYVVVGGYKSRNSTKECTRNPFNWLVAGEGMAPAQWPENALSLDQLGAAWHRLAQGADPVIALQDLPQGAGKRVELPQPKPEDLSAHTPPAAIRFGWRMTSYSSLAHGVRRDSDAAAADRDVHSRLVVTNGNPSSPDDILNFPRGSRAGECLHAVFEHVDFTFPLSWPEKIADTLRTKPPATGADTATLAPMVQRMLTDVMATALPGNLRLGEVTLARRRAEFEFSLSTRTLDTRTITAVLKRHGYADPRLDRQSLQGYLRGFIDLVFEHGGRFHIIDWKSNYLGASEQDYAKPRVLQAMEAEGYHLQYLLYAVALHRWLKKRKAGYSFGQHFGGVYYLFVRGVRPGWKDTGVFHVQPSLKLVEELDGVLG